jgi:hypothetical protein
MYTSPQRGREVAEKNDVERDAEISSPDLRGLLILGATRCDLSSRYRALG